MKCDKTQAMRIEQAITQKDVFYNVYKNKIPQYAEIVVNFFDLCNMQCVFCPQNHGDRVGATREEILSKIPLIVKYIETNPSHVFHLHIMGGELFQDQLIQEGFLNYYSEFIENLKQQTLHCNKQLNFYFITNLVFKRRQEVKQFCDKHDLDIAVSYDPTGRFNQQQFKIFQDNILFFQDYIRVVSLTITKTNIQKISEGDEYFDFLYQNFPCDWDFLLVGDEKIKHLMPSESELLSFYKILIDKYPNCINILPFTEQNEEGKFYTIPCTRGNNITIFSDNSIPKGCSGSVILKNSRTKDLSGVKIIQNFFEKRNCFQCEYYKRCTFSCFVSNDYKDMIRDLEECVFKEAFKYAKNKKGETI